MLPVASRTAFRGAATAGEGEGKTGASSGQPTRGTERPQHHTADTPVVIFGIEDQAVSATVAPADAAARGGGKEYKDGRDRRVERERCVR